MQQPSKPFDIDKREVNETSLQVRSSCGAAGVDGVTVEQFESDLKSNLSKIWNQMEHHNLGLLEVAYQRFARLLSGD